MYPPHGMRLVVQLQRAGIDLKEWKGINGSESINKLRREIASGETRLHMVDGLLIREIQTVQVIVTYRGMTLQEGERTLANGKKERRNIAGLNEKMRWLAEPPETPEEAAARCLLEEIQVVVLPSRFSPVVLVDDDVKPEKSYSFPGLMMKKTVFTTTIELSDDEYRPWYQETTKDGTKIVFEWK